VSGVWLHQRQRRLVSGGAAKRQQAAGELLVVARALFCATHTRAPPTQTLPGAPHYAAPAAAAAAVRFITDRVARQRPRTPGEEVGQNLVLAGTQVC
jgi:hypothetical protein